MALLSFACELIIHIVLQNQVKSTAFSTKVRSQVKPKQCWSSQYGIISRKECIEILFLEVPCPLIHSLLGRVCTTPATYERSEDKRYLFHFS